MILKVMWHLSFKERFLPWPGPVLESGAGRTSVPHFMLVDFCSLETEVAPGLEGAKWLQEWCVGCSLSEREEWLGPRNTEWEDRELLV